MRKVGSKIGGRIPKGHGARPVSQGQGTGKRSKLGGQNVGQPAKISEDREQQALFEWMARQAAKHPELAWAFAVPNGARTNMTQAIKLKRTGMKAGVPDVFIPAMRGNYGGLFIEMKRQDGGIVSPEQKRYMAALTNLGYKCVVAKGVEAAIKEITEYLRGA